MIHLVSYPRSGNTFFRYCLEYLTKKPTLGCRGNRDNDPPVHKISPENIKVEKKSNPVAKKAHWWERVENDLKEDDSLIVVNRFYLDCFGRRMQGSLEFEDLLSQEIEHYTSIIKNFDSFDNIKHFVYYEDLIEDDTLESVLYEVKNNFNVGFEEKIGNFMKNIDWHRKNSLNLYENNIAKSLTKGESKNNYRDSFSHEQKVQLKRKVKENLGANLYREYLGRYTVNY